MKERTQDQIDASRKGCRCAITNGWVFQENGEIVPCPVEDHTEGWPLDLRPDSTTRRILLEEFKCWRCGEPITRLEQDPRWLLSNIRIHVECGEKLDKAWYGDEEIMGKET